MKPIVFIFGPTACGKTALSLSLAKSFDAEIVSADSMQIYRGLDIGTAKIPKEERGDIPHHMLDVCDMDTPYSVAQYREDALAVISAVHQRGRLPIVVGGTGQYFDALLYTPTYGNTAAQPEIRYRLRKELETEGREALHARLCEIDPECAARIHPNDEKRIIRALEIHQATGTLPSLAQKREKNTEFDVLSFFLNYPDRADLYRACDQRVLQMLDAGLLEEVSALLNRGLASSPTAAQAIGYKELIGYFSGEVSLEEATQEIQKRTRNYAKRQITWFSKMDSVALPSKDPSATETALKQTELFLKGALHAQ